MKRFGEAAEIAAKEAAGEIGSAAVARAGTPFNPSGAMTNCVNGVCAFLKSVKNGTLSRATADVAKNGGSIQKALSQIAQQTGAKIGAVPQFNALKTAKAEQFFIVFKGSNPKVSDHVAVGIVKNGRSLIYDAQTGQRFWNLADFGSFTAYPVAF